MGQHQKLRRVLRWAAVSLLSFSAHATSAIAADADNPLLGVWVGQTMQAGGKEVPAAAVQKMRWEFQAGKLLMRGNSKSDPDREEQSTYKIDLEQAPHELDFTPEAQARDKTVRGIFKISGDKLTVCMQHANTDGSRPSEFESPAGSKIVLMVLKKEPGKQKP
jgi:uncharacterized protein (TIGR03067 family)